ncbi:DUF2892 domain-containing protein [Alicyclobacillaceae bacterium I2511]|nr:DUF2892 domain-containing protein [Alicyclobacillaceae bacterium I2511]
MTKWKNEGPLDRGIRIVLGIIFIIAGIVANGGWAVLFYIIGIIALFTGLTGVCLLYKLLGMDTRKKSH